MAKSQHQTHMDTLNQGFVPYFDDSGVVLLTLPAFIVLRKCWDPVSTGVGSRFKCLVFSSSFSLVNGISLLSRDCKIGIWSNHRPIHITSPQEVVCYKIHPTWPPPLKYEEWCCRNDSWAHLFASDFLLTIMNPCKDSKDSNMTPFIMISATVPRICWPSMLSWQCAKGLENQSWHWGFYVGLSHYQLLIRTLPISILFLVKFKVDVQ